ncbi:MAG TPA: PIN domain-containing protein [Gemmataceae bacterium]|nr:PIN domain-containing protein [Gemmataceae bacterium]
MNLLDDIPAGAVIGLDTAPLIYYLEGHPDWGPLVRPLFDTRIIPGTNVAVTATITLAEVLVKPLRSGRADLVASYRTFLTGTPHLSLAAITSGVAEQGADFRARYGLRLPDACQVAAALAARATLFVTNDAQFRRVRELTVVVLSDYLPPPAPPAAAAGPVP